MALGLSLIHTTGHTQSHVKGQLLVLCVFPLFTLSLSAGDVWEMFGLAGDYGKVIGVLKGNKEMEDL